MGVQRKFADDSAALEDFFVELLVFFGVANVDARAQDADGSAVGGHGALMSDGVYTAGHAAGDDEAARGKIAAEALRHLRAVEGGLSGADNAEAGEVQNLGVATHVEKDWRIINLLEGMRVRSS